MQETSPEEGSLSYLHRLRMISTLKGMKSTEEKPNTETKAYEVLSAMHEQHHHLLDEIIKSLEGDLRSDPAVLLHTALAKLSKVDEQRFVIKNLLESLKRGDNIVTTLQNYKNLGLVSVDINATPTLIQQATDPSFTAGLGRFFVGLGKKLDKMALVLMEIISNAIKTIPMFIGIKPSIGMVGPVPSLSLELEGESLKLSELFAALRENL